jgi:RNA exonuclease NGL2
MIDFNFAPTDPAYRLLFGYNLTTPQLNDIEISRVVHSSIDPSIAPTPMAPGDDDGDATQRDPDRTITNARTARFEDGLLSTEEFCSLFNAYGPVRSVYEECLRAASTEHDNVIGARLDKMAPGQIGFYEPMWTSYTHYWKTTLGGHSPYMLVSNFDLN